MAISQPPEVTKLRIIKNMILISLAFFLLFTASDGLSMLQSTMNKKGGIGVISQAVSYISFCIAALLLPKYVIRKLGCKSSLIFSIFLYLPSIAVNIYPTWPLMITSAILCGIGASILWGSQCTYFNESAFQYAKLITNETVAREHSSEISALRTSVKTFSTRNCGGSSKRDHASEIPSLCTSVETLSIRYSMSEGIADIPLKDNLSINDNIKATNSEDSVVRHRYQIPNVDENEITRVHYMKNSVEISSTVPNEEKSKFDHLENSSSYDIPLLTENTYEIEKKEMKQIAKIPNVEEIVKHVTEGVTNLTSKGIPKLPEQSAATINQQVFQRSNTLESVTGIFFGCHSMAYYSAQIVSNAISYYILQGDEPTVSYSDGCSCGAQFCNDNSGCITDDTEFVSHSIRYLLSGVSVIVGVISILLLIFFVDPLQKEKSDDEPEKISLRLVSATLNHNKKKEQLCLIPMAFFEGMQQGFYLADFNKSYVGCAWGASQVGLVSVFFGSACVISSLVSGFLVKYAGRRALFLVGQLICIAMGVFLLLWEPNSETPYYFYIAAILFGTTTGIYWSQMLSFYGLLFKKDEEAAFATYYLWGSLGWTTSFLYSDYLCTYIKIYILLTVSIIGTTGYLFTERSYELRKQQGTIMTP